MWALLSRGLPGVPAFRGVVNTYTVITSVILRTYSLRIRNRYPLAREP
jgi:hypothetical protein